MTSNLERLSLQWTFFDCHNDFSCLHVQTRNLYIDGWMNVLRFYVLFNSDSVISGRREVDNEGLCAMELRLRLKSFPLER